MTPRHFCVAGVALGDIPWFHVAGVAQLHIHGRFAWQAWHKLTSTVLSCGRRGTTSHLPSFCVAGVTLMALAGALGLGLGARDAAPLLRGRRGTWWHPPWFHVAGVAQLHIHGRFVWQAWHKLTSTVLSRGRRGTTSHLPSFCVAGVVHMALGGALGLGLGARDARDAAPLLRGRRGTWWHPPWFHVAGVAQPHVYRRFAWQAWQQLVSQVKLVICMQRCGLSGMFLLSACFGMFDFGMFKHFLLSACYVLRHVWAFGMFKFGRLHAKMRSFRHVSSFRVLRHVWFWHV